MRKSTFRSDSRPPAEPVPGGVRELWTLALPLILSMGSQSLMMFADRLFLGWYSDVSLRAALPAGVLAFTLQSGFFALAGYSNTFVSQYHGAGDRAGCARSVAQSLWIALLATPLVIALIPAGLAVLRASQHGAEVFAEEGVYLGILIWGSLPALLSSALAGFFSGRGDTRTPMWAYLAGNALNVVLDYWFIFGGPGLPALGIRGAAYATVLSSVLPAAMLAWAAYRGPVNREYGTRRALRWDGPLFRRMIRFGVPSGIHLMLDLVAYAVFVLLAGRFGAREQSANSIALSVNALSFMPVIALGVAGGIAVGQYQGRNEPAVAARSGWTALWMGALYMAVMGAAFVLLPRLFIGAFAGSAEASVPMDEVFPIARRLLVWIAAWGIGDACCLVLSGALKGAGDTRFVMVYSLFFNWMLFIGGSLVVVFTLHGGFQGLWLWATLHVWLMAAGYVWRFARGRWQRIDLLGRRELEWLPPPAQPHSDALRGEG